jgi:hypothetical protein
MVVVLENQGWLIQRFVECGRCGPSSPPLGRSRIRHVSGTMKMTRMSQNA